MIVPDKVKQIALVSRLFYFALHSLAIWTLLYFKSPLQQALIDRDVIEILVFAIKITLSTFLYLISGRNPGFIYASALDKKIKEIELNGSYNDHSGILVESGVFQKENENENESQMKEDSKQPNNIIFNGINLQNDRDSQHSSTSLKVNRPNEDLDVQDEQEEFAEKRFCEKCLNLQPYRTKHCSQCERCIPKYDHHCFWIGGCVGELNHRLFWAFLLFQTIVNYDAFIYVYQNTYIILKFLRALDNYDHIDFTTGKETFNWPYIPLLIMDFVCFGFMLFTGILLLYHTILLTQGITTWEQTKRTQITYLKKYPKFYNPFNYGLIQNIQLAFFHSNKLRYWILPSYKQAQIINESQFNWFENQYYSCC